jgi:predicted acylesterase/phospholipase RssA
MPADKIFRKEMRTMKRPLAEKMSFNFVLVALLVNVTGCALTRNPVPVDKISEAKIAGMPNIRYWEVDYKPNLDPNSLGSSDCSVLALSGGGANGAFGAGFLYGWSVSGTRPNFRIVTGISTGALTAPLAFAGQKYDEKLKMFFTTVETEDILHIEGIRGLLFGESLANTKPLVEMIAKEVDEEVFKAVAAEYAKGRRLYIGTTNLDNQRFVVWDMGAIASSGHPDAIKLFRKVMLASSSIPGVFPPVYFDVDVNGKKYDEMHVDGGTITEVFGYGSLFNDSAAAGQLPAGTCNIYVIRNGKLAAETEQVPRKSMKIITRSLSTLMKAHSWQDIFRLYFFAQRDKVGFNYVSIPDNYVASGKEPFDPAEMKRLFDLGFEMAKSGYKWNKTPPIISDTGEAGLKWTP